MKKIIKKALFITFIFVIALSLSLISAFADVTSDHSSCADHYFDDLTGDGVPNNVLGSCGYVATTMLLAYYDSYWNDNFVSDFYEQDVEYNPDTREFGSATFRTENSRLLEYYNQYREDGGSLELNEYLEQNYSLFVELNRDLSFLNLYLIGIGIDNGYYSGILASEPYELSIYETAEILDAYFDGIFGDYRYYDPYGLNINSADIPPIEIKTLTSDNFGTSRDEVIAKIIELTNNNIPVMYRGEDVDDSGHRMIVYSVEEQENGNVDYQMHTGWIDDISTDGIDLTHTTLNDTVYNSDIAILWLEIDKSRIPHVCCNNYVEGNNEYCSCQVYGKLHPQHIHESDGIYLPYDNETHVSHCIWDGEEIFTEHIYENTAQYSSDFHWYECSCGEITMYQPHELVSSYDDVAQIHYYTCSCGYMEERHFFTYQDIGGGYHRGTCECGYTVTEIHNLVKKNPHYSTCMHCGYTKYTNGDIIEWPGILKRDDEEESE